MDNSNKDQDCEAGPSMGSEPAIHTNGTSTAQSLSKSSPKQQKEEDDYDGYPEDELDFNTLPPSADKDVKPEVKSSPKDSYCSLPSTSAPSSYPVMGLKVLVNAEQTAKPSGVKIISPRMDKNDATVTKKASDDCAICGPNHIDLPDSFEKPEINFVGDGEDPNDSPAHYWICCSTCDRWFHQICAGLEYWEAELLGDFHCMACAPVHGPSKVREVICHHRLKCFDESEKNLRPEIGTKRWVEQFVKWESNIPAPNGDPIMANYNIQVCENGFEFMDRFDSHATRNGRWDDVYLVKNTKGLQLRMPDSDFGARDVLDIFGSDYKVDTIDVYRQTTINMSLGKFVEQFEKRPEERSRLFNILSLEFSSNEELCSMVGPPLKVNEISWVHKLWPDSQDPINYSKDCDALPDSIQAEQIWEAVEEFKRCKPEVAMFCLMGMGGSYTDFHIDFGGSSVWYHIFKGEKVFYVIPPTHMALYDYEKHHLSERHSETFLGKMPTIEPYIRRVVIREGETLMIPSGWIHAVYTPVDSIVFGGNFLHSYNIQMQLRVYEIEQKIRRTIDTDEKFLFPNFELVNWAATRMVLMDILSEANDDEMFIGNALWLAMKDLMSSLGLWLEKDKVSVLSANAEEQGMRQSMNTLNYSTLKQFQKELAKHEKLASPKKKSQGRGSRKSDDGGGSSSKKKKKNYDDTTATECSSESMKIDDTVSESLIDTSFPERITDGITVDVDHQLAASVETSPKSLKLRIAIPKDVSISPVKTSLTPIALKSPRVRIERSPSPQEIGLKLVKKGSKYQSEVVEKSSPVIDDVNMARMFARRSSHGRTPKPSKWLQAMAGDDIERSQKELDEAGELQTVAQPVPRNHALELEMLEEEREMEEDDFREKRKQLQTRKKTPKDVLKKTLEGGVEKKKTGGATAKQRLASKLKMKF